MPQATRADEPRPRASRRLRPFLGARRGGVFCGRAPRFYVPRRALVFGRRGRPRTAMPMSTPAQTAAQLQRSCPLWTQPMLARLLCAAALGARASVDKLWQAGAALVTLQRRCARASPKAAQEGKAARALAIQSYPSRALFAMALGCSSTARRGVRRRDMLLLGRWFAPRCKIILLTRVSS